MLNRLRAGTHAPSREVLGAIPRTFGANAHVRDLVLHFLEHELAQAQARVWRLEAPKDDATVRGDLAATNRVRTTLRAGRFILRTARDEAAEGGVREVPC